jgi:glutamate synthase (NADPH/NADH) small chain
LIEADQVVKSIGQEKTQLTKMLGLATERGYIKVDEHFETSLPSVFAGGDCIRITGAASTVMAVQDGKLAARAISKKLRGGN